MKNKVFIIAEAGVNHNGNIDIAKKLIDVAVSAGADAVKFQTFKAENVISTYAKKAEYQKKQTDQNESQLEMARKLELSFDEFSTLFKICNDKNVKFLSTPFDFQSIDFLYQLGIEIFKIPSGEITNFPYLKKIANLGKKIIMSTGMSTLKEVEVALDILVEHGTQKKNIILLHCNTEYPTPIYDVNLNAMLTIQKELNVSVGYSDHTLGNEVALAAVAMGASVIEKHFTLDKSLPGPDHSMSLEPSELSLFIKSLRDLEIALGSTKKAPSPSERKNIPIVRKSIVAKRNIKKGEKFSEENLTTKRPGTGISPMEWENIIGSNSKKDFNQDDLIE